MYKASSPWCAAVWFRETWDNKERYGRRLEVVYNRCLKGILGITTAQQQRSEHLSSVKAFWYGGVAGRYNHSRRLRWLGNVARMDEVSISKKIAGWLTSQ